MEDIFPALHKWNIVRLVAPYLAPNGPYWINRQTHKIELYEQGMAMEWDTNWFFINQDPTRYCRYYTDLCANGIGFLHKKCLDHCWKVVFRPETIHDMLNMIPLMQALAQKHNFFCKLGMEDRPWTSGVYGKWGLWGCYFYNNSQKAGIFCWEKVKDALAENRNLKYLLDDVDEDGYPLRLVLKRGCTEFEVGNYGDSKDWKQTEEWARWQEIFDKNVNYLKAAYGQDQKLVNHVIEKWFRHGHHAGDQTIPNLNEGTMLWRGTRYYHKELFEKVKKHRNLKKSLKKKGG